MGQPLPRQQPNNLGGQISEPNMGFLRMGLGSSSPQMKRQLSETELFTQQINTLL